MKPYAKIGSLLLALIIAVAAVGCTPISLNAEWAYKTDKVELPIGVYSYSLKTAYSQAKNYASKLASYDEASDSWLDLEITDDEGDKAVARALSTAQHFTTQSIPQSLTRFTARAAQKK